MSPEVVIEHHGDDERQPRAVAVLAESQHGRVARRQLLALGVGRGAIARALEDGRLRRTRHRGVYAVGHRIRSRRATWMEAVLAAGPDAVLSHRSAGALWRFVRSSRVEVTTPRALRPSGGVQRHRAELGLDERTVLDGIPVTTVARTLFDLAAVLSGDDYERAVHEAEYLRLYDHSSLAALQARYPGHRGTRRIREPLTEVTREEFARRFRALLAAAGLRPPGAMNAWVHGREVDAVWWDEKVMVELDGWAAHGTRRAYERDRERDRRFTAAGWRVIRITWRQLLDEPEAIAADLAAILRDG